MKCFTNLVWTAVFTLLSVSVSSAVNFKVVHSFRPAEQGFPQAGLTADDQGNLYGTASGQHNQVPGKRCSKSCGGVYGIVRQQEGTIHTFNGIDGATPFAPLLLRNGILYGTTGFGGAYPRHCNHEGCGTVFEIDPDGTEKVLYNFCSKPRCSDGANPMGGLVADDAGNLYGTTRGGGDSRGFYLCKGIGCGVVFKLAPDGTETVLYAFCSMRKCADGAEPLGTLTSVGGNFYGTASLGGSLRYKGDAGSGVIFRIGPDGSETTLYTFCKTRHGNCSDGSFPTSALLPDDGGDLYGTTEYGGTGDTAVGTVFKLAPDGSETVLHSFCQTDCLDGAAPMSTLIADSGGNLYGTASDGGATRSGTFFQIATDGAFSVLHDFCPDGQSCADGFLPIGGLVLVNGDIYGTTFAGGAKGRGTVYRVSSALH